MKKRPSSKKKVRPAAKPRKTSRPAAKPAKTAKKKKAPSHVRRAAAAKPAKPARKAKVVASAQKVSTMPTRTRSRSAPVFNGPLPGESEVRRMADSAYMNGAQMEFFRQRLLQMRAEVVNREVDVKERLHQRESFADPADRATAEEEHWLDLRLRERESYLLRKIDESLQRIRDREYGYCEVTGEPIGIPRLLARPTATVCVDVKGQNEQIESQFRDR